MTALVRTANAGHIAALSAATAQLYEATTVDEVKAVRDKAEALRAYAKQAGEGLEAQNVCAELKLRAERRAGELLQLSGFGEQGGDRRSSNSVSLEGLGIERHQSSRWQRLASLPEADFDAYIASAFIEARELTSAGALKLAKQKAAAKKARPPLHVVSEPTVEAETATYTTLVIDPPWRYDNKATRGAAEDHYPTMSAAELAALDVASWAKESAHLYCWVTNGFVREGFDLLDAWGFTYKTMLTWVKPQMGMGNYFRSSTEHVLFATKGNLPTQANNIVNWFEARRGKHSAKPESFYDIVEKASPGPYLEMFARRRRLGWASWGNEA